MVAVHGGGVFVYDSRCTRLGPLRTPGKRGESPGESGATRRGWGEVRPSIRLYLLEPWTELRTVLLSELRVRAGLQIQALHPRFLDCASGKRAWRDRGLFIARRAVLERLRSERPLPRRVFQLGLSGGSQELAIVTQLPSHAVVAVLTRCAAVRQYARTLVRTSSRDPRGFTSPRPADEAGVIRAARIADIVFADVVCTQLVERQVCRRLVQLRLLSTRSVDELRRAVKCRAE